MKLVSSKASLAKRLVAFMKAPEQEAFDALARDVFEYQYSTIEVVRRMADYRGVTPKTLSSWRDIPALPARAFKSYDMFDSDHAVQVFLSSGTSGAPKSRALFSESGLQLMEESIVQNAARLLFPDAHRSVILVLAPAPALAPHMIMAWGMERLIQRFGLPGSRFLVGEDGLDTAGLMQALSQCIHESTPVTLIGASFGFVHLLDNLAARAVTLRLPKGSRIMDAGGYKGRSRVLTRSQLDESIEQHLGVPPEYSVNLLGMTELASQFYDGVIAQGSSAIRRKLNAPWTRTLVLDPRTMEEASDRSHGLLCHWDLANLERPVAVLTDDIGWRDAHGWTVVGRAKGAESKGCSLTVDALLTGGA